MSGREVPFEDGHDALEGIAPPAATFRVRGHRAAFAEFTAAADSGRLHHAWLLQGPRGVGKATSAFAFARRLLGGDVVSGEATARQIAGGSHPSLVHLTRSPAERGAGFKTQVTVDEIRKLNRFFRTTSATGAWRIAIVDPADDMNRNAANALLKILEEPPERALFLLTNHVPGRLLATIRSRCRLLRFDPLPADDMAAVLTDNGLDLTAAETAAVAALSEGSVRTALTLVSHGGLEIAGRLSAIWQAGHPDWQAIGALLDAVTAKGREDLFEFVAAEMLKRLALEAERRMGEDRGAAAALARLHAAQGARLREGAAFNLDRKQLLAGVFDALFCERASGARRPPPGGAPSPDEHARASD